MHLGDTGLAHDNSLRRVDAQVFLVVVHNERSVVETFMRDVSLLKGILLLGVFVAVWVGTESL